MSAIKKILVPTDFSEASGEALRYACTLADALSASLHIIHVNQSPYVPGGSLDFYTLPPDFFQEIERAASSDLAALLTKEEMVKYQATLVQRTGAAAHEILEYLHQHGDIDIVVMATHGRGGAARLMMGSVADKVIRGAPCPVLTIRADGEPGEHANRADAQLAARV